MSKGDVTELVKERLFPAFRTERDKLDRIDRWLRWEHDKPHAPRQSTKEYKDLADRAQTPWLQLVVTSVAQNLYVLGYRADDAADDAPPWDDWQANGMDARQVPIHRAALGYGASYVTVLPGEDELTGDAVPAIRGYSPRRMMAFYREPEHDEWPLYALRADPQKVEGNEGYAVRLYDDERVWQFTTDSSGTDLTYVTFEEHSLGVCPVVRFANQLDLEGRTPGEVEPFIPVAGRIDQTVFDRLVVQRFASFIVRTVAGMAEPETPADAEKIKLLLQVGNLLISDNPETKFGALPASPLDGFIEAADADIRVLAAASQTPAHELLGKIANLSAEALAAARASLTAKVEERKTSFGESHEQVLRLCAFVRGDEAGARDRGAQVRWRDTEIRSLAQAADALGKMAQMLGVPVEMLWEKLPGFTQQDVERAKAIAAQGDSISDLTALLDRQSREEPAVAPAAG